MASFAGRRRAAPAWSIDDASTFAALKEFKLLQFLSTDKKALTTARRLGLNFSQSQPQSASRPSVHPLLVVARHRRLVQKSPQRQTINGVWSRRAVRWHAGLVLDNHARGS